MFITGLFRLINKLPKLKLKTKEEEYCWELHYIHNYIYIIGTNVQLFNITSNIMICKFKDID